MTQIYSKKSIYKFRISFCLMMILFLYSSCSKKSNYVYDNDILNYLNFNNQSLSIINQLDSLGELNYIYGKNSFKIQNNKFVALVGPNIKGNLFNIISDYNFSKRFEAEWDMEELKKTSKLYYLGKIKHNNSYLAQLFYLRITDLDSTFLSEKMIRLNSQNGELKSISTLSEYACFEECVGKETRKKNKEIFLMKNKIYYSPLDDTINEYPEFYVLFKYKNNGFVEIIKD